MSTESPQKHFAQEAIEKVQTFEKNTEFSLLDLLGTETWDALEPNERQSVGMLFSAQLKKQNLAERIGDTLGRPSKINLYKKL